MNIQCLQATTNNYISNFSPRRIFNRRITKDTVSFSGGQNAEKKTPLITLSDFQFCGDSPDVVKEKAHKMQEKSHNLAKTVNKIYKENCGHDTDTVKFEKGHYGLVYTMNEFNKDGKTILRKTEFVKGKIKQITEYNQDNNEVYDFLYGDNDKPCLSHYEQVTKEDKDGEKHCAVAITYYVNSREPYSYKTEQKQNADGSSSCLNAYYYNKTGGIKSCSQCEIRHADGSVQAPILIEFDKSGNITRHTNNYKKDKNGTKIYSDMSTFCNGKITAKFINLKVLPKGEISADRYIPYNDDGTPAL